MLFPELDDRFYLKENKLLKKKHIERHNSRSHIIRKRMYLAVIHLQIKCLKWESNAFGEKPNIFP